MKCELLISFLIVFTANTTTGYPEQNTTHTIDRVVVDKGSFFKEHTEYYYDNQEIDYSKLKTILLSQHDEKIDSLVDSTDMWGAFSSTSGILFVPAFLVSTGISFDKKSDATTKTGWWIASGSLLSICFLCGSFAGYYQDKAISEFNNSVINKTNAYFDINIYNDRLSVSMSRRF